MKFRSIIYTLSVLIQGVVMTSCVSRAPKNDIMGKHSLLIGQGYSKYYADGYVDGCYSGKSIAGEDDYRDKKDTSNFMNISDYANGWQQGYDLCREESLDLLQQENMSKKSKYYQANSKALEDERSQMWDQLRK